MTYTFLFSHTYFMTLHMHSPIHPHTHTYYVFLDKNTLTKIIFFSGGATECKTKWTHVRDQFRRILKKRKTSTGMSATTVRKYKYEDLLQFIVPQMGELDTLSNIPPSTQEQSNSKTLKIAL